MIVGGYDLQLYCDRESPAHGYKEFPHQFSSEFGHRARRNARRAGWKLNLRDGTAICPKCSGKKTATAPAAPVTA